MITTDHLDLYYTYAQANWDQYNQIANASDRSPICIEFETGSKYIKAIHILPGGQKCVHGFIVREDGKKFKAGDILKAASWRAPAMNYARGNIINKTNLNCIVWTGVI